MQYQIIIFFLFYFYYGLWSLYLSFTESSVLLDLPSLIPKASSTNRS